MLSSRRVAKGPVFKTRPETISHKSMATRQTCGMKSESLESSSTAVKKITPPMEPAAVNVPALNVHGKQYCMGKVRTVVATP